jgi:hypothetical protein
MYIQSRFKLINAFFQQRKIPSGSGPPHYRCFTHTQTHHTRYELTKIDKFSYNFNQVYYFLITRCGNSGLYQNTHGHCSLIFLPAVLWSISCIDEHPFRIWHILHPPKTNVWQFAEAFSAINSFKQESGLHFDSSRFLTSRSASKLREWTASSGKTTVVNEIDQTKHSFKGRWAVPKYPSNCVPLSVKLLTTDAKWY